MILMAGPKARHPLFVNKAVFIILAVILCSAGTSHAGLSEFDISDPAIPLGRIVEGTSGKDAIPDIFSPVFLNARKSYIFDDQLVIGLFLEGEAKAYPINILNWHEIVNDNIGAVPVAVTFCPLTKTPVVFDRRVGGKTLEFGVSGLLYNNNLIMYDRFSHSLWPQMLMMGATGRFSGKKLEVIPSMLTTWGNWRKDHPDSLVLSRRTSYRRDYDIDPYAAYHKKKGAMFPMRGMDRRLPAKSTVIGIKFGWVSKAYPVRAVQRSRVPIEDEIAGRKIEVHKGPQDTAYIKDEDGDLLPGMIAYWFAWSAFNQDTFIYGDKQKEQGGWL